MSVLEKLIDLYKHNCCNCTYLDVLLDEPLSFRFDCFCPDFDGDNDPEYYWNAWEENDCRHFTRKPLRGSDRYE